jgi:hypothetical protein
MLDIYIKFGKNYLISHERKKENLGCHVLGFSTKI